jgi:hypothetical protein
VTISIPLLYLQVILNVASFGAGRIARDRAREWYLLVSLTHLTDRQIVMAYVWNALRRIRRSAAFLAGCLVGRLGITLWALLTNTSTLPTFLARWSLPMDCLLYLGLVMWVPLATVIGISVGMRVRGESAASLTALAIVFGVFIVWLIALVVLSAMMFVDIEFAALRDNTLRDTPNPLIQSIAITALGRGFLVALLPMVLTALLARALPGRARRGL